jgi:hypothetical protein
MRGNRHPTTLDWTISATRRTRWPVEGFAGVDVPLGETAESYDCEIYDNGYTTLKRTFSSLTSATTPYTNAEQVTDFGAVVATVYCKWYQRSSVVGRGWPLQASYFHSVKIDGSGYDEAVLALAPLLYYKMDGSTTTVTDSGSAANNGTASATNVTYQQTGLLTGGTGYSMKFTTGYVSVPHNASMNGAYTVVFKMQPAAFPGAESGFLHKGDYGSAGNQGHFWSMLTDGKLKLTWYNGASRTVTTTAAFFGVGTNVWVALTYNGTNSVSIYKNGGFVETLSLFNAFVNNSQAFLINGSRSTSISGFSATNTMDEFAWFNSVLTAGQLSDLYEAS